MILNESYDFYFENNGRCPECGRWLVPQIGCIGVNMGEKSRNTKLENYVKVKLCSVSVLCRKKYNEKRKPRENINYLIYALVKKYAYKRKYRQNLDIQEKRRYIKTNN